MNMVINFFFFFFVNSGSLLQVVCTLREKGAFFANKTNRSLVVLNRMLRCRTMKIIKIYTTAKSNVVVAREAHGELLIMKIHHVSLYVPHISLLNSLGFDF